MSELDRLIAEQRRDDAFGHRVMGDSLLRNGLGYMESGIARQQRRRVTDDRHGTLYCYVRLRCRCVKCRAVSARYARERRARRAA